ncbi:MAG: hypothetical protein ABEJ95_05640 [Candidatus Nanohalobium sp.]
MATEDTRRYILNITPETYRGDVHGSVAPALKELITDSAEARDFFGIRQPNRVITEGADTENWNNTEDWAITGSYSNGEIIMGQTVSCNGKETLYDNQPREIAQIRAFESRLYTNSTIYDRIENFFTVNIKYKREDVRELEKQVKESIGKGKTVELNAEIRKLDKKEEPRWKDILAFFKDREGVQTI